MIIEFDCGNSFIKWRVLNASRRIVSRGVVEGHQALTACLFELCSLPLTFCRLVSVRSDEENLLICEAIEQGLGLPVAIARPQLALGGVTNGYLDYTKLGLDRWLAVVAGYGLAKRACLIIDVGSAVTSDFVEQSGCHLGGYICPGLPLMRDQLGTHTRRIRYGVEQGTEALSDSAPGRATAEAVERGCLLMLRAFVADQYELAGKRFGGAFDVFLTGGDADVVKDVLPCARLVPDLVFDGLEIACPVG